MTAVIALSGEKLDLDNAAISLSLQFEDDDKSGDTSSTTTSEKGIKAKELKVSGTIAYKNEKILQRLFAIAEATGSDGKRTRYRVANTTAQAVGVREVIFSSNLDVTEQQNIMAWQIQFTLLEQRSVAEKKQERAPEAPAVVQKAKLATTEEPSTFDKLSASINNFIGGSITAKDENTKNA